MHPTKAGRPWYNTRNGLRRNAMILPDFLVQDADGYIHLAGHRVGLQDLTYYYNEGCSAEELCEVFPTLPLAMIHKVIAFYLEHAAEVGQYSTACEAEMDRQ